MVNIAVLVSGGGTNLQAIIDGISDGRIENGKIVLIVSSKSDAYALERGAKEGIKGVVLDKKTYPDPQNRSQELINVLKENSIDMIVLAGYMSILPPSVIKEYEKRIINIHPSLIPKHCGKGYYGIKVHESVIASGDEESGATVHYVDEGVDTGSIIIQERVPVKKDDKPEDLAKRVLEVEHKILVRAVSQLVNSLEKPHVINDNK